jgi:hypothetical protein
LTTARESKLFIGGPFYPHAGRMRVLKFDLVIRGAETQRTESSSCPA